MANSTKQTHNQSHQMGQVDLSWLWEKHGDQLAKFLHTHIQLPAKADVKQICIDLVQ